MGPPAPPGSSPTCAPASASEAAAYPRTSTRCAVSPPSAAWRSRRGSPTCASAWEPQPDERPVPPGAHFRVERQRRRLPAPALRRPPRVLRLSVRAAAGDRVAARWLRVLVPPEVSLADPARGYRRRVARAALRALSRRRGQGLPPRARREQVPGVRPGAVDGGVADPVGGTPRRRAEDTRTGDCRLRRRPVRRVAKPPRQRPRADLPGTL